jgi:hypothetical protein
MEELTIFKNFCTFYASRKASISSRIRKGDFDIIAIEYCNAKLANDFSPPDN